MEGHTRHATYIEEVLNIILQLNTYVECVVDILRTIKIHYMWNQRRMRSKYQNLSYKCKWNFPLTKKNGYIIAACNLPP